MKNETPLYTKEP